MSEQSGFLDITEKISVVVDKIAGFLASALFGAMTVAVLVGVFFRFVLNSPLSWPEEVSRYLMIWGASVAVSIGVRENEHVGLTILLDALKSPVLKKLLSTIIFLIVLSFLVFMFVYSAGMAFEARTRYTMALGITMFLPTLAVPVSMALAAIQLVLAWLALMGGASGTKRDFTVIDI